MTERISFPENLLPLAVIKVSFKTYFHEMEKLLLIERIFEEQNGSVSTSQNKKKFKKN